MPFKLININGQISFFFSMSLQQQSDERKKRLLKLKESTHKRPAEEPLPIKFKSYSPETKELRDLIIEPPKVGPQADDTVEKKAKEIRKEVLEQDQTNEELDLSNLKPKKANWDLKRDLSKKLDRLEKLTNIAMADLISVEY
jgi:coiled-coil domain-containing protein 12